MTRLGDQDHAPSGQPNISWLLGASGLPAAAAPDSVALVWEHGSRTYAQLRSRALILAQALRERGLNDGDRVATMLLNRGETFELYFACAYAGLTLVPLNFRLTARELGLILRDSAPEAVFVQAEFAAVMGEALASADIVSQTFVLDDEEEGLEYAELMRSDEPLATFRETATQLILYTSGTTGVPKGVPLTHVNILWLAWQQAALYRGLDGDAVTLIVAPTYNTAGINEQSIPTFLVGGTVAVLPSRNWSPRRLAGFVDRWKVTHCVIFPSMVGPLIEANAVEPLGLKSLKWALAGGENCPPLTMQSFRETWPHIRLMVAYGSTEAGLVSFIEGDDIMRHAGSVGRITQGQTVRILRQNGSSAEVDEVGEVWTAGPSVISSYWNAEALSAETVQDGWLKTGDLGRLDIEGYLYIEGRSKDLIISKGQNIFPAEIENVLKGMTDVADATVIGVPDTEAGEAVCAVVIRASGSTITEQQVIAHVRHHLASYKKPKFVLFRDQLPRNATTKVLKPQLVDECAGELAKRAETEGSQA